MMIKLVGTSVVFLLAVTSAAIARPPPGVHIDPAVAAWFHSLKNPRSPYPCCDVADCRRANATIDNQGHYKAVIRRKDFDGYDWEQRFGTAQTTTLDIPDAVVVIRSDNPTNSSVVCYGITNGEVFCFVPRITAV